jgi:hypothetical protein
MAITSMVLSDPARGLSYTLIPNDAVKVADYEITATVRSVSEDHAAADGALDTTQWLSAAAVTIDLAAVNLGTPVAATMDSLSGLLLPFARPYLVVTDSEWSSPRQIQVRFSAHTHPYEQDNYRAVQLAFVAPRGLWEDTTIQQVTLGADVLDTTGFVFTDTLGATATDVAGFTFNPSTSAGSSIVTVAGNARPSWRARLYGPAAGPILTNDTTGQSLVFTESLLLGPGDYLELDSVNRTAVLLSQPDASRLQFMDFSQSQWLVFDPGVNRVRYHAASGTGAGTQAQLTIFPVWLP